MSETGPPTYRLEDLKQRWEQNPSSRLYLQLAEEYRRLERLDEAVQVLEEGLESRPGDLSARVALGRYSLAKGDVGRAEEALAAAVERDPTHLVANKALLEVYLLQGSAEKAGERLEIYRLLNDRDPELEHLEFRLHSLRQSSLGDTPAPSAAEVELEELISSAGISATPEAAVEPQAPEEPEDSGEPEAPEMMDLEATHPALHLDDLAPEPAEPSSSEGLGSIGGNEMSEKKNESQAGDLFDLGMPSGGMLGFDAFWNDVSGASEASTDSTPEVSAPAVDDAFAGFGGGFAESVVEPEVPTAEVSVEVVEGTAIAEAVEVTTGPSAEAEPEPVPEPMTTFEAVEPEGLEVEPLMLEVAKAEAAEVEAAPEVAEPAPTFETPVPVLTEIETSLSGSPEMEAATLEPEPAVGDTFEAESAELESAGDDSIAVEPAAVEVLSMEDVAADSGGPEAIEIKAPVRVAPPEIGVPAVEEPGYAATPEAAPEIGVSQIEEPVPAAAPGPQWTADAASGFTAEEPAAEDDEVATVTLGSLYLKQGHVEEARRIFEKVLESDPKNHAALAGLGLTRKGEKTGLTAMDLLAGRSMAGTIPAGVTAKKMLILTNYLKHLKSARERNHVR